MRKLLFVAAAGLAVAGCAKDDGAAPAPAAQVADVPEVTVDELAALLAGGTAQAVDANGDTTRRKLGVIPGAVLLSDSEYFTPSELPADKAKVLVFYCANPHCGASHEAAVKARSAGYTRAKVLPAGIAGWVKAGNPTTRI